MSTTFGSIMTMRVSLRTQWISVTILYLFVVNPSGNHAQQLCNSSLQYLNESSNECTSCTVCEDQGLLTHTNCTSTSDSVCVPMCPSGSQFYDISLGQCKECSTCSSTAVLSHCTPLSDTVCHTCGDTQSYSAEKGACVHDCSKCNNGCTDNNTRCECSDTHFYDQTTGVCSPCSSCSEDQFILEKCTRRKDTVCHSRCPGTQYFNKESMTCETCTICPTVVSTISQCTVDSDTKCCHEKEFYNSAVRTCTPRCELCPSRQCRNTFQCDCSSSCQTGRLCDSILPNCPSTDPTDDPSISGTRPTESESVSISPVSSALIALGAVIGIILFSALFVLLGVISSCYKGSHSGNDSSSSNSTEDGKPVSTASLIGPMGYEYKQSLDLLRVMGMGSGRSLNSMNSSMSGSSSCSRGSPKSFSSYRDSYKDSYRDTSQWTAV